MKTLKALIHTIEAASNTKEIVSLMPLLREEIDKIFFKIKSCEDAKDAFSYFNILEEIHIVVARLIFKSKVEISNDLWKFFKDFDRIDDEDERLYFFETIKN